MNKSPNISQACENDFMVQQKQPYLLAQWTPESQTSKQVSLIVALHDPNVR